MRLLIDLKLRARELPQAREELLVAFDKIFYGEEPLDAIKPLTHIRFTQYINPIDITAILAQLFIIEQDIGYGGKSTFEPPSLYIHGWIRTFIEADQEIDQVVHRICRNTPPAVKYTCQDNKNHPTLDFSPLNPHSCPLQKSIILDYTHNISKNKICQLNLCATCVLRFKILHFYRK